MSNSNNDLRPQPRKGVLDIAAYVPGKHGASGVAKVYKLSANETPLGPSPKAVEAFRAASAQLEIYPDGEAQELRDAIGEVHGLNPANILCGNGSGELLGFLARVFIGVGDEAIITEHGFLVYKIQIQAAGGTPVVVKERDERTDVDAILAAVTPRTKAVFIANPNNPTGTYIPFEEVKRLHSGLRPDILLVLDAAYSEYVQRNDYEAGVEMVSSNSNVVMTRTFSKIYGLAGARIGWMYGPLPVVDAINRVREPFNLSTTAIAAGAAAVRDRAHIAMVREYNDTWLTYLSDEISKLGLRVTPSVGNFLLVHFPNDSKKSAKAADDYLTARGLILRAVGSYGFPNSLRLTVGTEEANRLVVKALTEFMGR